MRQNAIDLPCRLLNAATPERGQSCPPPAEPTPRADRIVRAPLRCSIAGSRWVAAVVLALLASVALPAAWAATHSAESNVTTVDTQDRYLDHLTIGGDASIISGEVRAYECIAWFSDGSHADVSAQANWTVIQDVPLRPPPPGTFFSGNLLTAGEADVAQTIWIRAYYTHRGSGSQVTRQSPIMGLMVQPRFRVSIAWEYHWILDYYTLSASSIGAAPGAVIYSWELDNDGQFDDGADATVNRSYPESRRYLIGVRAVDSLGAVAVSWIYLSVEKRVLFFHPETQSAVDVYDGAFLNSDGQPFTPDPQRANNGLLIVTHGLCGSATNPWLGDIARAVENRFAPLGAPNVCLYDWREMSDPDLFKGEGTSCQSMIGRIDELTTIKTYGRAHGLILADWLRQQIELGNVNASRPIHIIGHSAGGFVAGECALTLKKIGINLSQITMLDTPAPVGEHVTQFREPGRVDRYISSCYGRYARELDCMPDIVRCWFEATDEVWVCNLRINEDAYYHRYVIPDVNDHGYAHDWYTGTINADTERNGFWYSPWLANPFPAGGGGGGGGASLAQAAPPAEPSAQTLTNFQAFGTVVMSNGIYIITEELNAGIVKLLEMPMGAQTLRFRYRFTAPGDGDFLSVHWSTNAILYIGLDNGITRSNLLSAEVSVDAFAGQTNELVFKLVSRGTTNAILLLDQIELTVSDDPDGDGLLSDDEGILGTNPLVYDTDKDGLNDWAEVFVYQTNPLEPDSDNDGMWDKQEINAGTNPNAPESVFRLVSIRQDMSGNVNLEWTGSTNRFYGVHRATDPQRGNYVTLTNSLPGTDPVTRFTDYGATNATFFYWIELQ